MRLLLFLCLALVGCGPKLTAHDAWDEFTSQSMTAKRPLLHAEDEPFVEYADAPGFPYAPAKVHDGYVPTAWPESIPFDADAARAATHGLDFSHCHERGFGHATLVFAESGNVTAVVIDDTGTLSVDAATCVGRRLGGVTVPPFTGGAFTFHTTWFAP